MTTLTKTKIHAPELRFPEFEGEWEYFDLRDIAKIYDGTHQTPKYVERGVRFVSVENIDDIESTSKFITKEDFEKNFKIKPQKDDILMTRITAGIIGATAIVKNDLPLGYYVSLALIRKKEQVDVHYLSQRINCNLFKHELYKRIIHVAFPKKINLGDIGDCEISLPPISEQQKIATFLTAVDKSIHLLTQKKEKLEQYKKGVMQKLFSRELRFRDNNGNDYPEWEEKKLGEVATFRRGSFPQPYGLPKWYDDVKGKPFVQVYDVDDNFKLKTTTKQKISELAMHKSVFVEKGSIILTIQGSIGRIAITQYDAYVDRTLLIFTSLKKGIEKLYFVYAVYILFGHEKERAVGGTIKTITKEKLSVFKIKLPCFEEQQKIASFLSAIDKQIEQVEHQIKYSNQWKKGLLEKMFV